MKNIIFAIIFLAVLAGAGLVYTSTGQKSDLPYEAGQLHAPDIQHQGSDEGHGEAAEDSHS